MPIPICTSDPRRRRDLGSMRDGYSVLVPRHGVTLVKVGAPKPRG